MTKGRPGIDTQRLGQLCPCRLEDPECVCLSPAPVEGQHELLPETFAQGVLRGEFL
jgi:hypothetical protein